MKKIWLAAILLIAINLLLAACLLLSGIGANAEPERHVQLPQGLPWATVVQTASTHDGPGLRYAMTGSIHAGHAVEVLRVQDDWCLCLSYLAQEPVWICAEYLQVEP